jgi:hypothetical protein
MLRLDIQTIAILTSIQLNYILSVDSNLFQKGLLAISSSLINLRLFL